MTSDEFRTLVLDKHFPTLFTEQDELSCLSLVVQHDFQDRFRLTSLLEYLKERQVVGNLHVRGADMMYLMVNAFKNLNKLNIERFKSSLKQQRLKELHLNHNSRTTNVNGDLGEEMKSEMPALTAPTSHMLLTLGEASVTNYTTFCNVMTTSNP